MTPPPFVFSRLQPDPRHADRQRGGAGHHPRHLQPLVGQRGLRPQLPGGGRVPGLPHPRQARPPPLSHQAGEAGAPRGNQVGGKNKKRINFDFPEVSRS